MSLLIPDEITDDRAAIRAGGAISKAWSALLTEAATVDTAQALASSLRVAEVVPDLDWWYRHPDDVVDFDPARHPMRTLLVNLPAGPCCATADEIVERVYGTATA